MGLQFGKSIPFNMCLAGTNTPAPNVSPVVQIAKEGGPLQSVFGSIVNLGAGLFRVSANDHDTDTPGNLSLSATAAGCDQTVLFFEVLPKDHPRDMRKTESLLGEIIDQNETLIKRNY